MQRLRAVVASAHGDAALVQNRRHIVGMNPRIVKRDEAAALVRVGGIEQSQTPQGGQLLPGVGCHLLLVGVDRLESELFHEIQRRSEGGRSGGIRGACFESQGKLRPGRSVEKHLPDHLPATFEWLELLQGFGTAHQEPEPRRPVALVG